VEKGNHDHICSGLHVGRRTDRHGRCRGHVAGAVPGTAPRRGLITMGQGPGKRGPCPRRDRPEVPAGKGAPWLSRQ